MPASIRTLAIASTSLLLTLGAHAETRTFDVSGFSALDVSSGLDVTFSTGEAFSVTAEHDYDNWDKLKIDVRGDTLYLSRKSTNWGWGNSRKLKFAITVTAPELNRVESSSGSDVVGSGLTGELVVLKSSSGSDLIVTNVSATNVKAYSSSGSDLDISGTCVELNANSSSGSDLDASDLKCRDVYADASSGSDIEAYATELAYGDASSGADVNIYGGASNIETDKSSGGSVKIR